LWLASLTWWVEKAAGSSRRPRKPSARFVKAEADVAEVLARVTPQEAAPSTPKVTIPKLPPPTQPDRSSFVRRLNGSRGRSRRNDHQSAG
jgi:hypothetical protein